MPSTLRVLSLNIGLAALLAVSACVKQSSADFQRVELTKEDVISLFEVKVDDYLVGKFEWSLPGKRYVRAVWERSDDGGATWIARESYPYHLPVERATFIYKVAKQTKPPAPHRYYLQLRIGGAADNQNGWSGSATVFELPAIQYTSESMGNDPERPFLIRSGDRVYRLRYEASETPWPKA